MFIKELFFINSVISDENFIRSTAIALPAGIRALSPVEIISPSAALISQCNCPTALLVWSSDLNEFEQTSSANKEVLWAGVFLLGLISYKFDDIPILPSCHAASLPASPPPTIATFFSDI